MGDFHMNWFLWLMTGMLIGAIIDAGGASLWLMTFESWENGDEYGAGLTPVSLQRSEKGMELFWFLGGALFGAISFSCFVATFWGWRVE